VPLRFRPPRLAPAPEVRWLLLRAFGPAAAPFAGPVAPEPALALARRFEVAARIAARHGRERLAAELGSASADGFARDRAAAAAVGMRLMAAARRLAERAAGLGVPAAFLKFMALEAAGRLAPGSREACDVDALVPEDRAGELWRALAAAGYRASGLPAAEHQLPALEDPAGGVLELHRVLPGVRLAGGGSATHEALARAGLLVPLPDFPGLCSAPAPEVQAAHTLVHGIGQHGFWPASYSLLKMIADLIDLGSLTDRAAGWVARDVAADEVAAVRRLCARLAAGEDPAGGWDAPEETLLRHILAGRLDPGYERALRLGLFRSQPSDRPPARRLARSVLGTVFLSAAQIDAIYGPPRSRLGYLGRRLARPFDLLLRLGRYIYSSAVKSSRPKPRRPPAAGQPKTRRGAAPLDLRLATFFLWLLVLLPPFLLAPVAKESFRQPKLLASEWLALASLVCLAWGLLRVPRVRLAEIWRLPALRCVLPALLVATAGLATTRHPLQAREALVDFWIGGAALVGWSAGLPGDRLQRLLRGLLWPAAALGAIGILQFHGLWQPLEFFGLTPGTRLAVTSLAGNPGDLGAYLVLPALIAQALLQQRLRAGEAWSRPAVWGTAAAAALSIYGLLVSQTLAAIAALVLGSVLLWGALLPRRRAAALLAGGLATAALIVAVVPPLRQRVMEKAQAASELNLNWLLSGRLDGWRAAVWMLREHPLAGVGHGAYGTEFVPAKLALLDRGVAFFPGLSEVVFANPHNEFLQVAAEWGVPGLLALAWGLWVIVAALRRTDGPPEQRALAWAGTAALGVLSLAHFPFRVALVAFPALLFLSGVLKAPESSRDPRPKTQDTETGVSGRVLAWPLLVLLVLGLEAQTVRWHHRMKASRLLRQVELLSMSAASSGQASSQLMAGNLEALRQAAPLDPVEVGIPIARGTQYLFLGRPAAALRSYQEALALEPRPEGYLNLGRALWLAGRKEDARRSFGVAVRLDPRLAAEIPAPAR
jgi:O-antigen ligase